MKHRGLLHHLIITVSSVERSSPFYHGLFRYLGYELDGHEYGDSYGYEDWKRWDLDTPHEITIAQRNPEFASMKHQKGAVGHHHHIAFAALDRDDVDRFYAEVLTLLEQAGHCTVENPPGECPEYAKGYYATFFSDPDGLKYEFVINPNFHIRKDERKRH